LKKKNKIDRSLANLAKIRREKLKSVKSEIPKERKQQTSWKSRKLSKNTKRTYILINLKTFKKWADF
jgi:hypothetical protein